jgi:hypothetical protein
VLLNWPVQHLWKPQYTQHRNRTRLIHPVQAWWLWVQLHHDSFMHLPLSCMRQSLLLYWTANPRVLGSFREHLSPCTHYAPSVQYLERQCHGMPCDAQGAGFWICRPWNSREGFWCRMKPVPRMAVLRSHIQQTMLLGPINSVCNEIQSRQRSRVLMSAATADKYAEKCMQNSATHLYALQNTCLHTHACVMPSCSDMRCHSSRPFPDTKALLKPRDPCHALRGPLPVAPLDTQVLDDTAIDRA